MRCVADEREPRPHVPAPHPHQPSPPCTGLPVRPPNSQAPLFDALRMCKTVLPCTAVRLWKWLAWNCKHRGWCTNTGVRNGKALAVRSGRPRRTHRPVCCIASGNDAGRWRTQQCTAGGACGGRPAPTRAAAWLSSRATPPAAPPPPPRASADPSASAAFTAAPNSSGAIFSSRAACCGVVDQTMLLKPSLQTPGDSVRGDEVVRTCKGSSAYAWLACMDLASTGSCGELIDASAAGHHSLDTHGRQHGDPTDHASS